MAAVCAQLTCRDGLRQKVSVHADNNLSSLMRAVHELTLNVASVLNELVEREKTRGVCAEEEEEGSDEDDEEPDDPPKYESQPPAKRSKT